MIFKTYTFFLWLVINEFALKQEWIHRTFCCPSSDSLYLGWDSLAGNEDFSHPARHRQGHQHQCRSHCWWVTGARWVSWSSPCSLWLDRKTLRHYLLEHRGSGGQRANGAPAPGFSTSWWAGLQGFGNHMDLAVIWVWARTGCTGSPWVVIRGRRLRVIHTLSLNQHNPAVGANMSKSNKLPRKPAWGLVIPDVKV